MPISPLLDHLIGPLSERLGDYEAEGLRGLEVDDELELRGLLDRNVSGPGTFQNLVHEDGRLSVHVSEIRAIAHQSPGLGECGPPVYRRQAALRSKRHDLNSVGEDEQVVQSDESAGTPPRGGLKSALEILATANLQQLKLYAQGLGHDLSLPELGGVAWVGRIPEDRHPRDSRNDLLEETQPFPAQLRGKLAEARDVAARPSQARDEPCRHRITDAYHNDGDCPGYLLGSLNHRRAYRNDNVRVQVDQLAQDLRDSLKPSLHRSKFKDEVLSLHVAP